MAFDQVWNYSLSQSWRALPTSARHPPTFFPALGLVVCYWCRFQRRQQLQKNTWFISLILVTLCWNCPSVTIFPSFLDNRWRPRLITVLPGTLLIQTQVENSALREGVSAERPSRSHSLEAVDEPPGPLGATCPGQGRKPRDIRSAKPSCLLLQPAKVIITVALRGKSKI